MGRSPSTGQYGRHSGSRPWIMHRLSRSMRSGSGRNIQAEPRQHHRQQACNDQTPGKDRRPQGDPPVRGRQKNAMVWRRIPASIMQYRRSDRIPVVSRDQGKPMQERRPAKDRDTKDSCGNHARWRTHVQPAVQRDTSILLSVSGTQLDVQYFPRQRQGQKKSNLCGFHLASRITEKPRQDFRIMILQSCERIPVPLVRLDAGRAADRYQRCRACCSRLPWSRSRRVRTRLTSR